MSNAGEDFVDCRTELGMHYVNGVADCSLVSLLTQDFTQMSERLLVLVDEDEAHIEQNSLRSVFIYLERRFFTACSRRKGEPSTSSPVPFHLISPTTAEAINQGDAEAVASTGIEQALLEIANQIVNKYLVFRQAVRFELSWTVGPIVVTFCQGEDLRD